MTLISKIVVFVVVFTGIVAIGALISAFPVKWLWNWLMPELFNLRTITFWQAWGLSLLCGCLFKSPSSAMSSRS